MKIMIITEIMTTMNMIKDKKTKRVKDKDKNDRSITLFIILNPDKPYKHIMTLASIIIMILIIMMILDIIQKARKPSNQCKKTDNGNDECS